MQTRSLDFKLRANAPKGQKRFPLRGFPLRFISAFRHSFRWLRLLPVILLPLVAPSADAVTRHDVTRPRFEESRVSKLPKDQQAIWKCIASNERSFLPFSGVLISDCAFFENASEGIGKLTADEMEGGASAASRNSATLQVENGTGDGSYPAGMMVTVTADPAPAGQRFVGWTGDIAILSDASMATTTAMIPFLDVTIAAKYQLNVQIGFPIDEN